MANYKKALENEYRYDSSRGLLSTEDLFQVPLRNNKGFNLGQIAKTISANIKESDVENFVPDIADDKATTVEKEKLDIVKDIIASKLEKERINKNAENIKAQKAKLLEVLAKKRDESLESKTEEEILAELAALDA